MTTEISVMYGSEKVKPELGGDLVYNNVYFIGPYVVVPRVWGGDKLKASFQ